MADWFAIYETATGKLVSVGTVIADDIQLAARSLSKKNFGATRPDQGTIWNSATLEFDPKPRPVRTDEDVLDTALADAQAARSVWKCKDRRKIPLGEEFSHADRYG